MSKCALTTGRDIHSYETRGRETYRTGQHRTGVYEHLPSQAGVHFINKLPNGIKNAPSPQALEDYESPDRVQLLPWRELTGENLCGLVFQSGNNGHWGLVTSHPSGHTKMIVGITILKDTEGRAVDGERGWPHGPDMKCRTLLRLEPEANPGHR
ncbi:hypothetical protein J6590_000422 [Homalodisca vitripennis]|nr:hypothetical protein J6590_000422 [Homalodisca vitripennis]